MRGRTPFFRLILALLVLAAPSLRAQDGLRGALSKMGAASNLPRISFGQILAAADFDNDQKPDGALLLNVGEIDGQRLFRIELHVSAIGNQNLTFVSKDTELAISALDVNQDGMPDLIVEHAFTHKRLQVWLNDGHGRFRRARVEDFPQTTDTRCSWRSPSGGQDCVIASLPSRSQSHSAILLVEILRFGSSSSHWKVRPNFLRANQSAFSLYSPRPPPAYLLL